MTEMSTSSSCIFSSECHCSVKKRDFSDELAIDEGGTLSVDESRRRRFKGESLKTKMKTTSSGGLERKMVSKKTTSGCGLRRRRRRGSRRRQFKGNACDGFGDDEIEHEMMSGSSQSKIACKKDYEKPGRHKSEEKTKVHPKGYQAILEWKDSIPVGDWAVRFNNLIDYLIRDKCSINIAHNFEEQGFKGIRKIWEKLMDHYCLVDNPESWDYVIPRMAKLIRGWKSDLKKRYFTKVSTNWKMIYELDKRVSI
ncbi:uncharacterized protein A4U43_C06F13200 [Asparagus officinalis]|uniref:Uncharacterized protein n=1 Tax=Asparagus officinalis TaxID=4686 RepID=A0A5P1EMK5_ASPOF|nr:uncharacterized protein A4U43_C06F13200 [Asparagus officinalis]